MTAVDLNINHPRRRWPAFSWSFKPQLEAVGIQTIPKEVWKGHMHAAVWPEGTNVPRRFWRIFSGLISGFWLGWFFSGGRMKGAETAAVATCYVSAIVTIGAFVATVVATWNGFLDPWILGAVTVASLSWGLLGIPAASLAKGNPLHDDQINWFYKYPDDFQVVAFGPVYAEIPQHIQQRLDRAEQNGWSWKLAWTDYDPLPFIYPRFQPWRKVCVGGWDTDNKHIDGV